MLITLGELCSTGIMECLLSASPCAGGTLSNTVEIYGEGAIFQGPSLMGCFELLPKSPLWQLGGEARGLPYTAEQRL